MPPYPQRCAVAACGNVPTQIEYYEYPTEGVGGNGIPVCCHHTGLASHKWQLTGIEPIIGRVQYATGTTKE